MKSLLILLGALACQSAWGQVSTNTQTTAVAGDLTPALTNATLWSGGTLPGKWKDVSTASGRTSKELTSLGTVFGVRPQQVLAFYENGQLDRLEVIWLETGNFFGFRKSKELDAHDHRELPPSERNRLEKEKREKEKAEEAALAPKRKEFAERFQLLEKLLPPAINEVVKTPGKRISLGGQGLLRSRATEWVMEGVNLRFVAEDDQLIGLTIQSATGASRKFADSTGGTSRRRDAKDAVQTFPTAMRSSRTSLCLTRAAVATARSALWPWSPSITAST